MKRLNVFNDVYGGHNLWYKFKHFCQSLKFAWQRITRGYCDMDTWSIDCWFLNIMPPMLDDLRESTNGYPHGTTFEDWQVTLAKMARLFQEANKETCKRANPLQKEYERAQDEFDRKYGTFGEKLRQNGERRIFTLLDMSEYEDIAKRHMEEERKIDEYRNECKNEALAMFSKYFWDLWD